MEKKKKRKNLESKKKLKKSDKKEKIDEKLVAPAATEYDNDSGSEADDESDESDNERVSYLQNFYHFKIFVLGTGSNEQTFRRAHTRDFGIFTINEALRGTYLQVHF